MTDLSFDRDFDVTPGISHQISPLIRRVLCDNPSPFTFKGTSSFVVGRGNVAIIDPGPDSEEHLQNLLAATRGETVSQILITHAHLDHSPLARRLQEVTGAPVLGHPLADARGQAGSGLDAGIDYDFRADRALAHGETLSGEGWTLEAVFTPGHMSNHLCFSLNEENTLFSGDHVMAWATSVIAPPDGNMGDYFESLRKLLARPESVYLPAHGPGRRDPLPLVRGLLAHRRMREEAIYRLIETRPHRLMEIVRVIYAGLDPKLHAAAARSTQAHLDHLAKQGRVESEDGLYRSA